MGNGTTEDKKIPAQVEGISDIKMISAGNDFSVALKDDGTVWAWGYNQFGVFGNSYPPLITMPLKISDMKNIKDISAGTFHYAFLKMNGTIQEFGWDYSYSIG